MQNMRQHRGQGRLKSQVGLSLTGFLVFSIIAIAAAMLGFKIGPAYAEFYTIQKAFRAMANDASLKNASRGEINVAFNNRATIDGIKAITYNDIEVSKDGNGLVFSAEYSVRVPLFYNLSACMDFQPSSAGR
jgi:hypothetical protein